MDRGRGEHPRRMMREFDEPMERGRGFDRGRGTRGGHGPKELDFDPRNDQFNERDRGYRGRDRHMHDAHYNEDVYHQPPE